MALTHEITAARDGDLTAFARLIEAHHGSVCAITTAILGDPVVGEDAAQEAFLTCWRKLAQLDDPARFSGWLHQIARNTARMHQRSARRRPDSVVANPVEETEPAASTEDALQAAETSRVVASAVADLPEDVREVLVLYYREGRSTAEVASQLALSEAAVRKRLSRARETLKADVEERFGGWMERSRPRAGFVAAVLVTIGLAGLSRPAEAASKRGPWLAGAAAVLSAPAVLFLWSWGGSAAPVGPSIEGRVTEDVRVASVLPRAAPLEIPSETPSETPSVEQGSSPVSEALYAIAQVGGQRLVRCDVTALGVPAAELVTELGRSFPPAVDVTDGVLTLLTDPSEGGYFGASFRDQSVALDLEPGEAGSVTGCTIKLGPPFTNIAIPETVTLDDLVPSMEVELEKSADHDRQVTPLQLALQDPNLSVAARQLIDGWVARQGEEAERALRSAEMWSANPGLTITLRPSAP